MPHISAIVRIYQAMSSRSSSFLKQSNESPLNCLLALSYVLENNYSKPRWNQITIYSTLWSYKYTGRPNSIVWYRNESNHYALYNHINTQT